MPLDQEIERRYRKRQASLKISRDPMHDFLEMANHRQHRKHCFNDHPLIPGSPATQLEVRGITGFGMKAGIAQHNHALLKHLDQGMKQGIVSVGRRPDPTGYQPQLRDQQAEFSADDPAVVRFSLSSKLRATAAFANRMQQFNPIAVHYPQYGRT